MAVGALVAWRRPGNPIGWLMLAGGASGLLSNDAGAYAALRYDLGYRLPAGPLAVLLVPTWSFLALTFALVILLFPDGRLPSRRWRWVMWSYVLLAVAWPASVYVITIQALLHGPVRILPNGDVPGVTIDRITSRTLAYTIVTGLLIGVYAGLVLLATRVLPVSGPVAVAGATLAVAALFSPLRRRVQALVDRRFNRARYDADQTVTAFAARLKDALDLDTVRGDLASVVHQALEPAHVSVWLADRR